jgi:hypothetical protein
MPGIYVPSASFLLPPGRFEAVMAQVPAQRVSWMKGHACPCTFSPTAVVGRLSTPGGAQKACQTCLGLGFYWDAPTVPFRALISFMHMSPSPDEPGTVMNANFGAVQVSEPSLTIPYQTPGLAIDDPAQPTAAWSDASTDDLFIAVDMLSRYTAKLQVGGIENLPFQQNLQIAPSGAVTVWDSATSSVVQVPSYGVSGPTVTIDGYPNGTSYMVEFQSASLYVAFRRAGGLPHVRPFGGGTLNEPRRFRLQTLDFWTRQRGIQASAPGSTTIGGTAIPYIPALAIASVVS